MVAVASPITILVAEDQEIVHLGLSITISKVPHFQIVGRAYDGISAIEEAVRLSPTVILMDIGLPKLDGVKAASQIKKRLPKTKIIMFTAYTDDDDLFAAFGAGADGYCLKNSAAEHVNEAIEAVLTETIWLDPQFSDRMTALKSAISNNRSSLGHGPEQSFGSNNGIISLSELNASAVTADRPGMSTEYANDSSDQKSTKKYTNQRISIRSGKPLARQDIRLDHVFADRYLIESIIGEGGMGTVYLAKHLHMQRRAAIKVLHAHLVKDVKVIRRFTHESKAASTLNHPNVITVFDFGLTSQGLPFLVMDYVPGKRLDEILKAEKTITLDRFQLIFTQILDGLIAAHSKEIVHCDLKPSNIMLLSDNNGLETVKILDFGLAKVVSREPNVQLQMTDTFEVSGSPIYMSPEQCKGGKLDFRSDLYSLACVMYETLSGLPVYDALNAYELFYKHVNEMPVLISKRVPGKKIPKSVERFIFKALSKDPEKRYQSAYEMKEALKQAFPNTKHIPDNIV